jgi:hypothetical protein
VESGPVPNSKTALLSRLTCWSMGATISALQSYVLILATDR